MHFRDMKESKRAGAGVVLRKYGDKAQR
jgi:hypothetical protein